MMAHGSEWRIIQWVRMQLPDSRIACTNIIHLKTSTAVEQEVHIFYFSFLNRKRLYGRDVSEQEKDPFRVK